MSTPTMKLTDLLLPETVKVPLDAIDKVAAIEELVDLLAKAQLIREPDALIDAVLQRERQRTTGIGEGLAIPHGKSTCTDEVRIAIGRPAVPMPFDSVDRKPVELIVLLASPPDRTSDHIQALGRISRLMADVEFRARAYAADSAEQLYAMLAAAEEEA